MNFLNAVAKSDPYGLWDERMQTGAYGWVPGFIERRGDPGNYSYRVMDSAFLNRPVWWVDWWDAARFANWMHNGQPRTGVEDARTTEDGAYALHGRTGGSAEGIERNPKARYFIPTINEWYKAAYYQSVLGVVGWYWDYPTKSNTMPLRMLPPGPPISEFPSRAAANYSDEHQNVLDPRYIVTPVGAYRWSAGPWGTFDQGGNVFEWVDYPGTSWKSMAGGLANYPGTWLYAHNQPAEPDTPPDWYWTTFSGFRLGSRVEPFQQERPQIRDVPPSTNGQKKIIVFTHGRDTSEADWVDSENPCATGNKWRDFYRALYTSPYTRGWEILPWGWTDKSNASVSEVLSVAWDLGKELGNQLSEGGYDLVHLIGFSAGSALIARAAEVLAINSPNTIIHSTFLDPYAGLDNPLLDYESWVLTYGYWSDWADQYATRGDYPYTYERLPYAHNVDVTDLGKADHDYAVRFYTQTILDPSNPRFGGYGFARSMEYGGWNDNRRYALGNAWVRLSPPKSSKVQWNDPLDISPFICETSPTGDIQCGPGWIQMTTASPVWLLAEIPIDQPVNMISLDLEFTSQPGAEGYLAIYWDDQVIGLFDERLVEPGRKTYTLELLETALEGIHYLGFRLDPYTDVPSRVLVENIRLGYAEMVEAVPEPAAWLIAWLGLPLVFGSRRCWRRR